MTRPKPRIGDVAVIFGTPPPDDDGHPNPYRGKSAMGSERARALRAFRDGEDTSGFTLWFAPCSGGAYKIESAEDVNWCDMRD